jgi:hypothetical protein
MSDGPDRRAFDVVTEPVDASGADFRAIAHSVAAVDTLGTFLRDLRARYPETGALSPRGAPPKASQAPPGAAPAKPDPAPTGSIKAPARPGRTAQR